MIQLGSTLGHYEIVAALGKGGMGEVWRARDTKLGREVAIKTLPPEFAEDPERLARFEREAKLLASLNHPNIAAIYGLEEHEGSRFLVLELVEGATLADRVAHGAVSVDESLGIGLQIAGALEAAHDNGVIHRDLKPANIKVTDDGTVKVLDFGLAKALAADDEQAGSMSTSPTLSLEATRQGVILGTAAYMSPEQARGKNTDKRADIWAFGVVLYELLTGRQAFAADDVSLTLSRVLQKEPDFELLPDGLSPSVRAYLRRCLEKDPKRRIRDIGDVRLALDGAFETGVDEAGPALSGGRFAAAIPIAILVSLVAGAFATWRLIRSEPEPTARLSIPIVEELDERQVAISPDGRRIAFGADGRLWLRELERLESTPIPGTDGGGSPSFSPDGRWISFYGSDSSILMRVAVTGGAPMEVTAESGAGSLDASWADNETMLYSSSAGIFRVSVEDGESFLLFPAEAGETLFAPSALPGGETVLFTARPAGDTSWDNAEIVLGSVATRARKPLIQGRDARYVSTGHLVYALGNDLLAVTFDPESGQVGSPIPLVQGVRRNRGGQATATADAFFDVSSEGTLVYLSGSNETDSELRTLVWVGLDGTEDPIPAPPRAYRHPRVSPDGTRIVFDVTDGTNRDVMIWDLEGQRFVQLTDDEGLDAFPVWAGDDRVIFYSSRNGGGVYWKSADGSGPVELLMEGGARPYSWLDSEQLVFLDDGLGIGLWTLDSGEREELIPEGRDALVSPDGRWVAYVSLGGPYLQVRVKPFPEVDDGDWAVSQEFARDPVWSPDGSELFFRSRQEDLFLMASDVETEPVFSPGAPRQLSAGSSYDLVGEERMYDIAPEGDRFLMLKPVEEAGTDDDSVFEGVVIVQNWFEELRERVPVD